MPFSIDIYPKKKIVNHFKKRHMFSCESMTPFVPNKDNSYMPLKNKEHTDLLVPYASK